VPAGSQSQCVESSSTLVEQNGGWVLVLVAAPVLLSALTFVSLLPSVHWDKYAGRLAAVGLMLFCVVLLISIGLIFLPSLLLFAVALFLDRKRGLPV
jgi:hypothetical protein